MPNRELCSKDNDDDSVDEYIHKFLFTVDKTHHTKYLYKHIHYTVYLVAHT